VHFFNFDHLKNYTSKFRPQLSHKILCSFSSSSSTHLLLPSSSYPWLPMVVSFFLSHLLLEVAFPIIFLPSPFRCHDLQEARDSIDEEDPRLTSSTWSYITTYPSAGGRCETHWCVFQGRKMHGVATNVYLRKKLEKTKRDL